MTAPAGVDIVELADCCAAFRARSLDLFELTGGWITVADDATEQRWFADAARRHAWHAELWAERSPSIPPVDAEQLVARHRAPFDPTTDRTVTYLAALDALLEQLDRLEDRLVPELDPNTVRTVRLVRADLVDLRAAGTGDR